MKYVKIMKELHKRVLKDKLLYIILFLALIGFLISYTSQKVALRWDEAVYLSNAENLISKLPYYFEEHRSPLLASILYFGSFMLNLENFAKIFMALSFSLSILLIYLVSKESFNKNIGLISAVLLTFNFYYINASKIIMVDIPTISLSLLAFYFLIIAIKRQKERLLYISGFCIGLSILMWYPSLGLLPIYFVYYLLKKIKIKQLLKVGLGLVLVLFPYFLLVYIKYGNPISAMIKQLFIVNKSPESYLNLDYYLVSSFIITGPAVLAGIVFYLIYILGEAIGNLKLRDLPLGVWFILFFIFMTFINHKEIRYITLATPPLFILAAKGYSNLKNSLNLNWFWYSFIVLFFILVSFLNIELFSGQVSQKENNVLLYEEQILMARSLNSIPVANYIAINMPNEYVIYSNNLYPVLAYYSKRKTIAFWPWDEGFYKSFPQNMPEDGWLVNYNDVDKHPTIAFLNEDSHFKKIKEFTNITLYEYHN